MPVTVNEGVDDVTDVLREADRPLAVEAILERSILAWPVDELEVLLFGVELIPDVRLWG